MDNNKNGFSAVGIVLVLVIVGIIGSVGLYVMKASDDVDVTNDRAVKSSSTTETTAKNANGWTVVSSAKKAFSVSIPDGWKIINDTQSDMLASTTDPADLTYTKGIKAEVTKQSFAGTDAPIRFNMFTAEKSYQGWTSTAAIKTEFVTDDGVKGTKYSETYGPSSDEGGIGPLEGEKAYEYEFLKNGTYVHVAYRVLPGDTDNLAYVEKALKTLAF